MAKLYIILCVILSASGAAMAATDICTKDLLKYISKMEERMRVMEKKVYEQEINNQFLQREVEYLKSQQCNSNNNVNRKSIDSKEQYMDKTQQRNKTNQQRMMNNIKASVQHLERHEVSESPRVAFSVYLDTTQFHLTNDHTLQFHGVILNDGNGYNKFTGVFTAPQAGVYLFFFAIMNGYAGEANVKLVIDGQYTSGAIAETDRAGINNQGGNMAIVRLQAGQAAWLADDHAPDATVEGHSDLRETTFSGVLLY